MGGLLVLLVLVDSVLQSQKLNVAAEPHLGKTEDVKIQLILPDTLQRLPQLETELDTSLVVPRLVRGPGQLQPEPVSGRVVARLAHGVEGVDEGLPLGDEASADHVFTTLAA